MLHVLLVLDSVYEVRLIFLLYHKRTSITRTSHTKPFHFLLSLRCALISFLKNEVDSQDE